MTTYQPITKKTTYYNTGYDINGNVIGALTNSFGVVSGFASGKYVLLKPLNFKKSFEMVFKCTTGSDVTTDQEVIAGLTNPYFCLFVRNGTLNFNIGDGSSWFAGDVFGKTTLSTNTTYYVKLTYSNGVYSSYLSTNGTTWNLENTYSHTCLFNSCQMVVGVARALTTSPWLGSNIDFRYSYIKCDDKLWWTGTDLITNTKNYPNGYILGQTKNTDCNINVFNSTSYLTVPGTFAPTSSFDVVFSFTTGANISTTQYFMGCTNGSNSFLFGIVSGLLYTWLSTTGSSWDIHSSSTGISLLPNTKYYIKLSWNGSTYTVSKSEDKGSTWITKLSLSNTTKLHSCIVYFGDSWDRSSNPFYGTFDLNACYINVNGSRWWNGTKNIAKPTSSSYMYSESNKNTKEIIRKQTCYYKKSQIPNGIISNAIVNNNGIISGFSSSNHFQISKPLADNQPWEFVTKITLGAYVGDYQCIFNHTTNSTFAFALYGNGSTFNLHANSGNGSSWSNAQTGTTVFNPNSTYWFKISKSNNTRYVYWSTNGTTWNLEFQVTDNNTFQNSWFYLGHNAAAGQIFIGSIDLKNTYINVNGKRYWDGVKSFKNKFYSFPSTIFVGPLNTCESKINGFVGTTGYMTIPVKVPTSSFELVVKARTPNVLSGYSVIQTSTKFNAIIWRLYDGYSTIWLSSNGTSNNVCDSFNPGLNIPKNANVWFKVTWDGSIYSFSYSLNGTNWITGTTVANSTPPYWNARQGLGGGAWESYPWLNGQIDLNGSYLNIDGSRYWTGSTMVTPSSSNYDFNQVNKVSYLPTNKKTRYYKKTHLPNGLVNGSLTTDTNGIISGFTTSNFLTISKYFDVTGQPWEFVIKVRTGSIGTAQSFWFCKQYTGGGGYISTGGKFQIYMSSNGSSWNIASEVYGNYVFQPNTDYWIKLEYTGTNYKWYYSLNGTTWNLDITINNATAIYPTYFWLGLSDVVSAPWLGSIDLSQCYIKSNGKYWWRGLKHVKNITYTPNGNICGNLYNDNGKIYNFSSTNFCTLKSVFSDTSKPWEFRTAFMFYSMPSGGARIIGKNTNDLRCGMVVGTSTDYPRNICIWLSSNNSAWDISQQQTNTNYVITPYTKYYMKINFTGSAYTLALSTDNINFTTTVTINSSAKISNTVPFDLGSYGSTYVTGNMYLKDTYVNINGSRFWSGTQTISPSSSNYDYTEIE